MRSAALPVHFQAAAAVVVRDAETQVVANVGPAAPLVRQLASWAGASPLASGVFEMRVLA